MHEYNYMCRLQVMNEHPVYYTHDHEDMQVTSLFVRLQVLNMPHVDSY